MANETLFSNIYTATPDVVKKTDVASVVVSLIILAVGVAFFVSSFQFDVNSGEWSMLCLLIGLAAAVYGIVRLFVSNKKTVYAPTGSKLKRDRIYFKSDDLGKVLAAIDNNFAAVQGLHDDDNGTVRIDVLTAADSSFGAVQAYSFQGTAYEPQSAVKTFTGAAAVAALKDAVVAVKM